MVNQIMRGHDTFVKKNVMHHRLILIYFILASTVPISSVMQQFLHPTPPQSPNNTMLQQVHSVQYKYI